MTYLQESGLISYLMGGLAETRLSPGPQQHLWTTPFWRHIILIIPTGTHNLGMDIPNHTFQPWGRLLHLVENHRQALVDSWMMTPALSAGKNASPCMYIWMACANEDPSKLP